MNIRKMRESLGRAKASSLRTDLDRTLALTIAALKELGSQPLPTDMRGDLRTTLAGINADPEFKKLAPQGINYQPGKEAEICATLLAAQKKRQTPDEEEYSAALQRKLSLDRAIHDGKKFLAEGRPSDADTCFTEGLKFYRDETAAFGMMARAMMDAGEYVRALGYVRQGLKACPQDAALIRLGQECARLRAQAGS